MDANNFVLFYQQQLFINLFFYFEIIAATINTIGFAALFLKNKKRLRKFRTAFCT